MTSLPVNDSIPTGSLIYRAIERRDKEIIQKLHEDFFPVRYSPQFYEDIVEGVGIFNGQLYSIIVETEYHEVIGFILAQMLNYPAQCEDHDLFNATDRVSQVFYILTIGCVPQYRKQGVASKLIQMSIEYARTVPSCGAVYLHVIDYNHSAVKLYQKNRFQYLKTNQAFYHINNEYYNAFVYIYYLQDYRLPYYHHFYQRIRYTDITPNAYHTID